MANPIPRRFFDSDVITRLIENRAEASTIEALVQEASSGRWKLVISSITLLEVTREPGKPIDPLKHARIMSFFENDFIFVRELDILLAEQAIKLVYDYLWLRPMDAGNLSAAIDTGCQAFYTYDEDLIKRFDYEHGLRVLKPGMALETSVTDLPLSKPGGP